jgi:F-type H+-transporting ATPase subunit alpha
VKSVDEGLAQSPSTPQAQEYGIVSSVGRGIARVQGLPACGAEEVLEFEFGVLGMAFNLDPDEIGVVLFDHGTSLAAGTEVGRTGRVLDTPVGSALLGRVVDAVGRPMDEQGPLRGTLRLPVERPAAAIIDRSPVVVPLQTGIKVIDALVPVGRGQRELILGDRQTGKTAIAVDTILNQQDQDVLCVYCAIGQRSSAVANVIQDLRERDALQYSIVIVTTEEDPPGLQFVAPYAAMSAAEYFMQQGRDVLVVMDDLTHHARAYRELSLLLRRPPGREAFPGDIFYIHSRLLERSTRLQPSRGGGSVTALPIVETEAQNLSAYIPTNLISITDGQVYLSPDLFHKGILPAVDVGRSVSRVGGKTQLASYRAVAGDLRLAYSQFEELEAFARFGTRLDEDTRRMLERGRRVREVLKQPQYHSLPVPEQIAVFVAVNTGVFDSLPIGAISNAEGFVCEAVRARLPDIVSHVLTGQELEDQQLQRIESVAREACSRLETCDGNG